MTENTPVNPFQQGLETAMDRMGETMDRFMAAADVAAVYGEPVMHGENMIIPAAEVISVAGFGMGFGGSNEPSDAAGGGGSGGGGRIFSRPVAVVVANNNEVKVKPVFDVTKVLLAWFTALGFIFVTVSRMRRGKLPE